MKSWGALLCGLVIEDMFSMCEQLGLIQKQEGDDMMIHTQSFTILPIYSVYQQLFNPFNSIIHVFFF